MSRSTRMFEIIQLLRSADKPVTSYELARTLEVTQRTVYRDIASLQAMRVPIEGEAGIGYIMRAGFDLPPLMFTSEEIEAIIVGLALLKRTGDKGLQGAANSVSAKVAEILPIQSERDMSDAGFYVSPWGSVETDQADLTEIRQAIRDERKLQLVYTDAENRRTERTIKPLAMLYYVEVVLVSAWCELRSDFRHFRADRIVSCTAGEDQFLGEGKALRARWREHHDLMWDKA